MKLLAAILTMLAMVLPSWSATVYPASTNGNNRFTGSNTFVGPLIATNDNSAYAGNGFSLKYLLLSNPGLQSMGRHSWTNTLYKLRTGQAFNCLVMGDGLTINANNENGAYAYELINKISLKRARTSANVGVSFPFWREIQTNCISTFTGQDAYTVGFRSYLTGQNSSVSYVSDVPLQGNIFRISYAIGPDSGQMQLQQSRSGGAYTNLALLDAANATTNAATYSWTNSTLSTVGINLIMNTVGKTNVIINSMVINTNNPSKSVGWFRYSGSGGVTWSGFATNNDGCFREVVSSINPDAVLINIIPNQNDYTNMVVVFNRLKSAIPNADIIVCLGPPIYTIQYPMALQEMLCCVTNAVAFYDGYSPWLDFTNANLTLQYNDGVHPLTTTAYKRWNDGLWSWLSWYPQMGVEYGQYMNWNVIPTNLIPYSTTTETNWMMLNLGGIPTLIATNTATPFGFLQKALFP